MSLSPDVARVFEDARSVLSAASVPYAFIGAIPAITWGRPRATTDIDVVALSDTGSFARIDAELRSRGYAPGRNVGPSDPSETLPDIAVYWSSGKVPVRLDLFVAKTDFEQEVLSRVRQVEVLGRLTPIASPEACIIYKLVAARRRDQDDVEGVVDARKAAGDSLDWEFLERWAREWDVEERLEAVRRRWSATDGPVG